MIESIVDDLGVTVSGEQEAGSFSGSRVLRAVTRAGTEAMLKITVGQDSPSWRGSLRELTFYREEAERMGVRTPRLLDHRQSENTIAMVLTRHYPPRPAAAWTVPEWLQLAEDLAMIHRAPVQLTSSAPSLPTVEVDEAVRMFWRDTGGAAAHFLGQPQELLQRAAGLNPCFVHGDCHTDNISRSAGHLIWLDWQGSGSGNPAGDLAFPSVRAVPSGAVVPVIEMADRYAELRGLDHEVVREAVLASELRVLLFEWPHYAHYNTDVENQRVRDRVTWLARRGSSRG